MKPYFVKTPSLIQKMFFNYCWKINTNKKEIYLTFDDGPIPKITPWVLTVLEKYNAKATFFCVGENIKKHPEIFQNIVKKRHSIGNHTYNHLQGWKTNTKKYVNNVEKTNEIIKSKIKNPSNSKLFRPPHGKLKPSQTKFLLQNEYKIIMWDVLSADFDSTITGKKCVKNVINTASEGSIIVFHDSEKAFPNLKYALPKVLEYFAKKGYCFKAL